MTGLRELRVYTHPACRSCQDVIEAAKALASEREDIRFELTSLASEAGRERAADRDILVVPAVEVGDTVVEGALDEADLAALVEGRYEE